MRNALKYCAVVFLALSCRRVPAQPSAPASPSDNLTRAEQLADKYNWYDAQPFYTRAASGFEDIGDRRNALFAEVSKLRGDMQIKPLPGLVETIDSILATDMAKADKALRLRCLIVRGDIDLEIDAPAAKEDWEEALSLATEIGDRKWQNRAKGELGMIAFMLGDTEGAFAQVSQALIAAKSSSDVGAEIRYYAAIATAYDLAMQYQQAIRYFDLALSTASTHPETGFQYISIWGKSKALLRLGRIDEAEQLVNGALAQADTDDRRVKKVQLLVAAADIERARGMSDKAVQYLEQALPIATTGDFKRLLAAIYFELTELSLQTSQIPAASQYADLALQFAEQVGDRYFMPSQLLVIAKVRAAEGKTSAALDCLDRATDIIDGLLANAGTTGRASTLIDVMSSIYAYQFELAAENRMSAEYAFQVVERARGRVLSDVISLGRPVRNSPPTPESDQLEKELIRLQRSLLTTARRADRESTLQRIWQVEQRMTWAEAAASTHWTLRRDRALSLGEFQRDLRPEEAVLEYVFTDGALYVLVMTRRSASITRLEKRAQVEHLVRYSVERLHSHSATRDLNIELQPVCRALISPLRGLAGKSRVVIIPDGILNGVPFDVLVSAGRATSSPSPAVSLAPSATALYALRRRRPSPQPDLPLLAVGDVQYAALGKSAPNLSRAAGVFDARTKPDLGPLPASRSEVESAVRIFGPGSVKLLANDATEKRFKNEPLQRFEILHFAVHGFADPKQPQRAALMLAPDPSGDDDGFLQPREISQLPIAAKLVVLSACNTAVGHSLGEEGVANLSRAFLLAGASSVMTTLWSVSDTGSGELMVEFYRNLHSGQDVATALLNAKQRLLAKFGPEILRTIAAFQVVGNGTVTVRSEQKSAMHR